MPPARITTPTTISTIGSGFMPSESPSASETGALAVFDVPAPAVGLVIGFDVGGVVFAAEDSGAVGSLDSSGSVGGGGSVVSSG